MAEFLLNITNTSCSIKQNRLVMVQVIVFHDELLTLKIK
jgi:hypothetical protein